MFDPITTVLAAALFSPIGIPPTKFWKKTDIEDLRVSEVFETDRIIFQVENPTAHLVADPFEFSIPSRLDGIVSEIRHYTTFPDGWDGEYSRRATDASSSAAIDFICALPGGLPLPEPMMSPSGEIGFYWNEEQGYADVSFDADGEGSFFSKDVDGNEVFEDGIRVAEIDRAWFFDKIGSISAPSRLAA